MFNKPMHMHIYMYMLNLFGAIFTVKKRALFMKYFGASITFRFEISESYRYHSAKLSRSQYPASSVGILIFSYSSDFAMQSPVYSSKIYC